MTVFRASLLIGAGVCLPFLGSVGLWDPWETHYAEVGRQMLARADLVHPWWQNAYFFSKPPLVPWLAALGLFVSGAQAWGVPGDGPLPASVEWFVRLPVTLLLLVASALWSDTVARFTSRRVGLLTALVWWTMPLTCFLSRQLMTDGPFVACLLVALASALRAETDRRWWLGAFAACGVALLAKGLLGFLPFVLLPLSWLALEGVRGTLARLRSVPWWGPLVTLGLGAPWYVAMAVFPERDDEGRRFLERFFGYDHFDRLVSGVHTTTPGGTFTYFLEQGAFALAPWVVLVPLALTVVPNDEGPRRRLALTMGVTALVTFALFSASATRFHHYVFPVLPGLAVLLALAVDRLLDEGLGPHRPALALGAVLAALVWKDLWQRPRHLLDLFTYNHDRPYPDAVLLTPDFKKLLLGAVVLTAVALTLALVRRSAAGFAQAVGGLAVAAALFLSWQHCEALGAHWTQRALVDRYWSQRGPTEPLGAFLMNWKGETFYTRNAVQQLSARDPRGELTALVAAPGRAWVVVEHARLNVLRSALPAGQRVEVIAPETTNKFALLAIDDPW